MPQKVGSAKSVSSGKHQTNLLEKVAIVRRQQIHETQHAEKYERKLWVLRQCVSHLRENNNALARALSDEKANTQHWITKYISLERTMQDMQLKDNPRSINFNVGNQLNRISDSVGSSIESSMSHVMALVDDLTNIKMKFQTVIKTFGNLPSQSSAGVTEDFASNHRRSAVEIYQEKIDRKRAESPMNDFTIYEEAENDVTMKSEDECSDLDSTEDSSLDLSESISPNTIFNRRRIKRKSSKLELQLEESEEDVVKIVESPQAEKPVTSDDLCLTLSDESDKVSNVSSHSDRTGLDDSMEITECLDVRNFMANQSVCSPPPKAVTVTKKRKFFKKTSQLSSNLPVQTPTAYDTLYLDCLPAPLNVNQEIGSTKDYDSDSTVVEKDQKQSKHSPKKRLSESTDGISASDCSPCPLLISQNKISTRKDDASIQEEVVPEESSKVNRSKRPRRNECLLRTDHTPESNVSKKSKSVTPKHLVQSDSDELNKENSGPRRSKRAAVLQSFKEPSLHIKLRRP